MLIFIRCINFTRLRCIWDFETNYARRDIPNVSMVYVAGGLSSNQI